MKKAYYVSDVADDKGDHEVHIVTCDRLPSAVNRSYLGEHDYCYTAVQAAKNYFTQVNGCKYCNLACHTQ
jgi:sortase (surface protein transpeptidase)